MKHQNAKLKDKFVEMELQFGKMKHQDGKLKDEFVEMMLQFGKMKDKFVEMKLQTVESYFAGAPMPMNILICEFVWGKIKI